MGETPEKAELSTPLVLGPSVHKRKFEREGERRHNSLKIVFTARNNESIYSILKLSKIVWFIYVHVMAFSEVMMGIQKPWNHEITNSGHGCRLWNNYSRLEKLREIRNHHWDASWGAWDLFAVSPPFLDPLRCASMLDNLRYFVFKIICTSEVSTTKQWLRDRCNLCLSRSVIRW